MIHLQRYQSTDLGTFGRIFVKKHEFATIELPWRDNARGKSCVPVGEYVCEWAHSPRFGCMRYRLADVPGRDGIVIHPANWAAGKETGLRSELDGCIALGRDIMEIEGQWGVSSSRNAVTEFEEILRGRAFLLKITQTEDPGPLWYD